MKRAILILMFAAAHLFSAMILNLNVKDSKELVELVLNFDTPFTGALTHKKEGEKIVLHLKGAEILAPWQKKLDNPAIYQIDVMPAQRGADVILYVTQKVRLSAHRSPDKQTLFIKIKLPPEALQESGVRWLHILLWIVLFLAVLVGGAILLKLWQKYTKPVKTKKIVVEHFKKGELSIKFEKGLDEQNKLSLISFQGIDYLVLTGANNVLLGKYKEGEIASQEDFESVIQAQNVEQAVREQQPEDEFFTTIEEYKRKASGSF